MSPTIHLVDRNAKSIRVTLACRARLDETVRFTADIKVATCAWCKQAKLSPEEKGWGKSYRKPEERKLHGVQWCVRHKCEHQAEEFTSEAATTCRKGMREYYAQAHGRRTLYQRRRAS